MLRLRHATPRAWTDLVRADLTAFLQDHAANERKVAQSALLLATHYPRHVELVDAALEIADEELQHFRLVWGLLKGRGADLGYDAPDPYMKEMFGAVRKKYGDDNLLDRLVMYGIVEARGCERFGLLADAFEGEPLGPIYRDLERSEARHHGLYLRLARRYFDEAAVDARLEELLVHEAAVMARLPLRPALH